MSKTIKTAIATAILALVGVASATPSTPAPGAVESGSSATSYSGVGGGTSMSFAANRQTVSVEPGVTTGGATTILGQSVGAAGTGGKVSSSTASIAFNRSTGAGTGGAAASGLSTGALESTKSYSTLNGVQGSVTGNAEVVSGSGADAGKNGAAGVAGGATGEYSATSQASKTGLFSTGRTATTTAFTSTKTTPTLSFSSGNGTFGIQNEGAANASSVAKSGTKVSTN